MALKIVKARTATPEEVADFKAAAKPVAAPPDMSEGVADPAGLQKRIVKQELELRQRNISPARTPPSTAPDLTEAIKKLRGEN